MRTTCFLVLVPFLMAGTPAVADDLLTVAESSDYRATARYAEVVDLMERIAARSDLVHLTELGTTTEGRSIPLAIVANPPVATPTAARASGKPIVLAFGNIHAGEVCGKEALLMLLRELATMPDHPLLRDLVLLLVPIYNADGNERVSPDNRPGQVGPADGMGQRPNAQGLDLNRDWVKLEAPETRALVRAFTGWDPHLTIDTHTTNGSHHRYTMTYAAPLNPSGDAPSIEFVRDELLPAVTERLRARTGYDSFFYGNLNREQTVWTTYSADPRFGGPYRGLRGQMSILSEAYAYASYRDRVLVTLEFVREILAYAAEHRNRMIELATAADADVVGRGLDPQPDDVVGIRHRPAAFLAPVTVRGYVMTERPDERRPQPTDVAHDYEVVHVGRFEPTVSVRRPYAYVLPPGLDSVLGNLRGHGIAVEPFEGNARVEVYTVTGIDRATREFQGHRRLTLNVRAHEEERDFASGSMLVRTAQPLGTLAVYLLEPRSTDGLASWNFLDDVIEEGKTFPIFRVPARAGIR